MKQIKMSSDEKIYGALYENDKLYVIPPVGQPKKFEGNAFLWIIDEKNTCFSKINCFGNYTVIKDKNDANILFEKDYEREDFDGYPLCDFLGNKFSFDFNDNGLFAETLSKFYWNSILCECAERTIMRKKKRLREGYILSTLRTDIYGGTYPAVDHEFHIRGRLAMGNDFDAGVVKRMLELQL